MNLMSCGKLDEKDISVSFENAWCIVKDRARNNSLLGYANRRSFDNLYVATLMTPEKQVKTSVGAAQNGSTADAQTWHMRMGHAGKNVVKVMCDDPEYGMKVKEPSEVDEYTTCISTSQTKYTMRGRLVAETDDMVVHSDICGPFEKKTRGGKGYFAMFIVGKSQYCDIALLKT